MQLGMCLFLILIIRGSRHATEGPLHPCQVGQETGHGVIHKKCGEKVESVCDSLYMGVTFNFKLKWNSHIAKISSAANRMLDMA